MLLGHVANPPDPGLDPRSQTPSAATDTHFSLTLQASGSWLPVSECTAARSRFHKVATLKKPPVPSLPLPLLPTTNLHMCFFSPACTQNSVLVNHHRHYHHRCRLGCVAADEPFEFRLWITRIVLTKTNGGGYTSETHKSVWKRPRDHAR